MENPTTRRKFIGSAGMALAAGSLIARSQSSAATKKLVIIAGKPSHPAGMHEFNAGSLLLQECLKNTPGLEVSVHPNHWVKDEGVFDQADAVMIFSDGNAGHPVLSGEGRLEKIQKLVDRGVGVMMVHFAVEVPKTGPSGDAFREWIGGCYEDAYSCNPIWSADFKAFPEHEITRGVKPFVIKDEWYFSMRFRPETKDVTSILVATPSDETRDGPYVYPSGPYPHIQAAKGREETLMWCVERPDGGRGVGFTGGHFHTNWGDESFRKVILNAMLWISKIPVPAGGVESSINAEQLGANLDKK